MRPVPRLLRYYYRRHALVYRLLLYEVVSMKTIWCWLKDNDLPNWVAVAISSVMWPVLLLWWNKRKIQSISDLELVISPGSVEIIVSPGDFRSPFPTVTLEFINHTGSVVYITGASVRVNPKTMRVPPDAARDVGRRTHHVSFLDGNNQLTIREQTLQTKERTRGAIVLSEPMSPDFYEYSAPLWRRFLGRPKYFVLYYTAMVGRARHFVATVH